MFTLLPRSALLLLLLAASATALAQTSTEPPSIPGTIHSVLEADGRLKFVFIPDAAITITKGDKAPAYSTRSSWPQAILDLSKFQNNKANTFKVTSDKGKFVGYWVGAETPESALALQNSIMQGWSYEKVASFDPMSVIGSGSAFQIPEAQVMESLRVELLARAKDLACKSEIRPKEVSVTASLQASIGLIVGGAGTISFQATWETSQLCA